jgi:branched-chain amino acid transport system permease protein
MVNGLNLLFQFLDNFAFIVLAASGLAIIFGIMGVINLAHGEFILVGAYATTLFSTRTENYFGLGVGELTLPLPVAMLVGVLVAGVFGLLVERVVISGAVPNWLWAKLPFSDSQLVSPLYDRLVDSMVATWGLSLIVTQGVLIVFGTSIQQAGTPFGNVRYAGGEFSYSVYPLVLSGVAVVVLGGTYLLLRVLVNSDYGRVMVAMREDEQRTRMFGYRTERVKLTVFVIGGALAGLSGVLFTTWQFYITPAKFGLVAASLPVIWVGLGGRKTLIGPVIATIALQYINNALGDIWAPVINGVLLVVIIIDRKSVV